MRIEPNNPHAAHRKLWAILTEPLFQEGAATVLSLSQCTIYIKTFWQRIKRSTPHTTQRFIRVLLQIIFYLFHARYYKSWLITKIRLYVIVVWIGIWNWNKYISRVVYWSTFTNFPLRSCENLIYNLFHIKINTQNCFSFYIHSVKYETHIQISWWMCFIYKVTNEVKWHHHEEWIINIYLSFTLAIQYNKTPLIIYVRKLQNSNTGPQSSIFSAPTI